MEAIAGIAQHQATIAFTTGSVSQPAVFQSNPIGIVLDTVRGHAIISIINQGGPHPIEPITVTPPQFCRQSYLLVVRASKQLHTATQRLRRHVVGIEVQHTANGIAAIEQRRRTFDNLCTIHRKLVYLQSVIVAPLLSLVLDAVFAHHHAVITQAADGGFRLP